MNFIVTSSLLFWHLTFSWHLTAVTSSPVTLAQLQLQIQSRIETYTNQQPEVKNARSPLRAEGSTPSRRLQPNPVGRRLQIHTEYQLAVFDANTAAYVRSIVETAIQTIQSYLLLNTTSPPGPLLIPPIYYDQFNCFNVNAQTSRTGTTCASPGFSPSFSEKLSPNDVLAPYCGPALINKSHILDLSCLDGECQRSVAGGPGESTDFYLYVNSDVSGSCSVDSSGSGVAAFALPCFFERRTYRPLLGAFNICPLAFKTSTSSERLVALVVHEILHALGFNYALFFAFTGANGDPSKVGPHQ